MRLNKILNLFLCIAIVGLAGCASAPEPTRSAEANWKAGEDFYNRGRYEDAITQWKKVKESYATPELTALSELKIADAHFANKNYIEAAAAYEDFRKLHPNHQQAEYALYRLGLCSYNETTGYDRDQTPVKNAVTQFETFLQQYPNSQYVPEVKEKLAICRTNQARYEIYIGRFYLRTEKYDAAIKRLEEELRNFPAQAVNDEALWYLGQAYLEKGDKAKGRDSFMRLANEYPHSVFVDKAKAYLDKNY